MKWLGTILHEVFGLFVDDASFALAIVVWLIVMKIVAPHLHFAARWSGLILFAGLACVLIESALRYARRKAG